MVSDQVVFGLKVSADEEDLVLEIVPTVNNMYYALQNVLRG